MESRSYASLSDSEMDQAIEDLQNKIRIKEKKLSEIDGDIEVLIAYQEYLIKELGDEA